MPIQQIKLKSLLEKHKIAAEQRLKHRKEEKVQPNLLTPTFNYSRTPNVNVTVN